MAYSANHPQLIAHRGYSERYPENTLVGLEAALRAGADCIEFDVQFSKDQVPFVIHDDELDRTTGTAGSVTQMTSEQLVKINAGETQRFGDRFENEPIPTLSAVLELLNQWPGATAFVEIKTETIESIGIEHVVQILASKLKPFGEVCVLISFHEGVPVLARKQGLKRVGWVIQEWSERSRQTAMSLNPDILFCNYKKIPGSDTVLWPGPWQWALYDIVDPELAMDWIRRGVMLVESWDIGRLLGAPELVACLGKNQQKT